VKDKMADSLNMGFAGHVATLIFIALIAPIASIAQAGENWWVGVERVSALKVPVKIAESDVVQTDLGYMDEKPGIFMGARRDLNSDGNPEYILCSAETLCGIGGCTFAIFDGATLGFKGIFLAICLRKQVP
jgi:hypothetical protein